MLYNHTSNYHNIRVRTCNSTFCKQNYFSHMFVLSVLLKKPFLALFAFHARFRHCFRLYYANTCSMHKPHIAMLLNNAHIDAIIIKLPVDTIVFEPGVQIAVHRVHCPPSITWIRVHPHSPSDASVSTSNFGHIFDFLTSSLRSWRARWARRKSSALYEISDDFW